MMQEESLATYLCALLFLLDRISDCYLANAKRETKVRKSFAELNCENKKSPKELPIVLAQTFAAWLH